MYIDVDLKDPSHYAVYLYQAGLGLPDRDYYLKSDFAAQKKAYQAYVEQLLGLMNWRDAQARREDVVALETAIANASWTRVEQRDFVKATTR
jgi:putative endopeptidase